MKVLLVGTGYMAKEYAKVLLSLKIPFEVVGRGKYNCDLFKESYGNVKVSEGGLEKFIFDSSFTHGIISSNVDYLATHTKFLIENNILNILLEKPGGKDLNEILDLATFSKNKSANVKIAYNRRFYSSVNKCRELIKEDGGLTSFNFEFTEWLSSFTDLADSSVVKNNLLFANSTHVIDMAFFLGGFPLNMKCFSAGKLPWHPRSRYSGAGECANNVLFSYQANWTGPGRWSVEMITNSRRIIFRPMEQLQVQQINSVKIEPLIIDDTLDKEFKPGLYEQTRVFLFDPLNKDLLSIEEQGQHAKYYNHILFGN